MNAIDIIIGGHGYFFRLNYTILSDGDSSGNLNLKNITTKKL